MWFIGWILGVLIWAFPVQAENALLVAAASDLQFALSEIAQNFTQETGKQVKLSFGSSGNFQRQIKEGGPFEIYFSADEEYVLDLAKQGFTKDQGVLYAEGRIVLFVPTGSLLKPDASFKDLAEKIEQAKLKKFAIANPQHAPYGRAAKEALITANLWDKLRPNLVMGENISQAAQYATTTSGGIIAYSLALSPKISGLGQYALIPATSHKPLRQRMVLTNKAGKLAQEFYNYLQLPQTRSILKKYGFTLPGEE